MAFGFHPWRKKKTPTPGGDVGAFYPVAQDLGAIVHDPLARLKVEKLDENGAPVSTVYDEPAGGGQIDAARPRSGPFPQGSLERAEIGSATVAGQRQPSLGGIHAGLECGGVRHDGGWPGARGRPGLLVDLHGRECLVGMLASVHPPREARWRTTFSARS